MLPIKQIAYYGLR